MVLCIAPSVTVSQESEDLYLIYCWESHHYMQGSHFLLECGLSVEGIDLSDVAIKQLRTQYGTQGIFEVQDIRSFPIRPSYYTLIICSMVLSYLDDAELATLSERIELGLKPGGYLFIKDLSSNDSLSQLSENNVVERRNTFSREKAMRFFKGLTPIEVSLVFRKEPQRFSCGGYFDLMFYLGQKPEQ